MCWGFGLRYMTGVLAFFYGGDGGCDLLGLYIQLRKGVLVFMMY